MQHIINSRGDGLHVVGGAQRGVDERFHSVLLADRGETLQVHHAQVRVRGRLAHQQPGLGRDRRFHGGVVAGRHFAGHDAKPRQVLRAEFPGAVITFVEEHHLVAGVELGQQQSDHRRHAAGKQHGRLTAVQGRQLPLHHALAGVAVASVLLAGQLLLDELDHRGRVRERVRRGAKNRIGDRVGHFLPVFARVDGDGRRARARLGVLGVHRSAGSRECRRRRRCGRVCATVCNDMPTKKAATLPQRSRGSLLQVETILPARPAGRWHFSSQAASGRKSHGILPWHSRVRKQYSRTGRLGPRLANQARRAGTELDSAGA